MCLVADIGCPHQDTSSQSGPAGGHAKLTTRRGEMETESTRIIRTKGGG